MEHERGLDRKNSGSTVSPLLYHERLVGLDFKNQSNYYYYEYIRAGSLQSLNAHHPGWPHNPYEISPHYNRTTYQKRWSSECLNEKVNGIVTEMDATVECRFVYNGRYTGQHH